MSRPLIVVCGAGGFIGGHLIAALRQKGGRIRAVDWSPPEKWDQRFEDVENLRLDLRRPDDCARAVQGAAQVYNLAADMGGMGFIESHKTECMLNVLINSHLLDASRHAGVERFFFASSACVYAAGKQMTTDVPGLREADAYPADPEDGYGWEKLFSERMCRHFREDFGLATRIGRYHNVYGPFGAYDGGREKAPSAICRKVAEAALTGRPEIEIWGDGEQTRSFTFIDDCTHGTQLLMQSGFADPLNIGSSEMVTINRLVDIVEEIAGVRLKRRYNLSAPKGVRGRNSDNTLIRSLFAWEPSTRLRDGLAATYAWVHDQVARRHRR